MWRLAALLTAVHIFLGSTERLSSVQTQGELAVLLNVVFHTQPSDETLVTTNLVLRKAAHLGAYAALTFFLFKSFGGRRPVSSNFRVAVWAILVALVYACTDDFHQRFVPGRGPSVVDWCIDAGGSVLAVILLSFSRQTDLSRGGTGTR